MRSEKIKEKKELKNVMISDIRNQKAGREMAEERRVLFQTAMMDSPKTLTESLQQQSLINFAMLDHFGVNLKGISSLFKTENKESMLSEKTSLNSSYDTSHIKIKKNKTRPSLLFFVPMVKPEVPGMGININVMKSVIKKHYDYSFRSPRLLNILLF